MPLSLLRISKILVVLVILTMAGATRTPAQEDPAASAERANDEGIRQVQKNLREAQDANTGPALPPNYPYNNTAVSTSSIPVAALRPVYLVKPGTYSQPVTVKMTDDTRGAIIYYTTDGWTPTINSNRYIGPIVVDSTTTLQAMAIVPGIGRSLVASGRYEITGAANSATPNVTAATENGGGQATILSRGTRAEFVFTGSVSSKNASVGDRIPVALVADLTVGGVVVAPRGTSGTVTIIQVDHNGIYGAPGALVFQVDPLSINGGVIELQGSEELDGEDAVESYQTSLIPVWGQMSLLKHGKDAEITKGMAFSAYVDRDVPLTSLR